MDVLLYAFCPAALYWWQAGVDPSAPKDMVWQMLEYRADGRYLPELLQSLGFGDVIEHLRKYLNDVDSYRAQKGNEKVPSPELNHLYRYNLESFPDRFGYRESFKKAGFDRGWPDLIEFVRLWHFVYTDWALRSGINPNPKDTEIKFERIWLAFTAPGIRTPAFFPSWLWRMKIGNVIRNAIGLLVDDVRDQDQMRFALTLSSAPAGEEYPWPVIPDVYALDRRTGEVAPANLTVPVKLVLASVEPISRSIKKGLYMPVNAWEHPRRCSMCGFYDQCYRRGVFSSFAFGSLGLGQS
jgi:hypothetical protein